MNGRSLSPGGDQLLLTQLCQVLGEGGLGKPKSVRQPSDRHFSLLNEVTQQEQPPLIGEEAEDLRGFRGADFEEGKVVRHGFIRFS